MGMGIDRVAPSQIFRKSNRAFIDTFKSKMRNINEIYAKAQIFVSLLLPSKSVLSTPELSHQGF